MFARTRISKSRVVDLLFMSSIEEADKKFSNKAHHDSLIPSTVLWMFKKILDLRDIGLQWTDRDATAQNFYI